MIAVLVGLFFVLQYKLWFSEGGLRDVFLLKKQVVAQELQNRKQLASNAKLQADVDDLKHGQDAVEEHARVDLGMIKQDETFYQFIPEKP